MEKLEKRRSSVGSVDSLKDIPQKMVNHGGGWSGSEGEMAGNGWNKLKLLLSSSVFSCYELFFLLVFVLISQDPLTLVSLPSMVRTGE